MLALVVAAGSAGATDPFEINVINQQTGSGRRVRRPHCSTCTVRSTTGLQRSHPQADRQVSFPDAGWPKQGDVLGAFYEGDGLELVDDASFQRWLSIEVKGIEGFEYREVCQLRT
jgi:hypothetical protein